MLLLKANLDTDPAQLKNAGHSTIDLPTAFLYGNADNKILLAPDFRWLYFFPLLLTEILVQELRQGFLEPSTALTYYSNLHLTAFYGSHRGI